MKRWALFVGLAACAAVAAGCGKEAVAPDSSWAAVSAKCQEATKDYNAFKNVTLVTHVDGDCEKFEFRRLDEPTAWAQVREETFYYWSEAGPISDTTKVPGEPEPDEVYVEDVWQYGKWRDPNSYDLDPDGQRITRVEELGMRYLPLYRWGCQAPHDPEITLSCTLRLSITTKVTQSIETAQDLGIRLGIGDNSNGVGGGVEVKHDTSTKQGESREVQKTYPATVRHDLDRSGEDNTWYIAKLRHYRGYLVRDVSLCKRYRKTGFGFTRDRLYCQLHGLEYLRFEAMDLFHLTTFNLRELREDLEGSGVVITPEVEALLTDLEQVSNDVTPLNPPMPGEISCKTNDECESEKVGVEVTASAMSRFGLSVSVGGAMEKMVSLTGTGGLSTATESTISTQQVHELEFEAGGKPHQRITLRYRQSELQSRQPVGSYYVSASRAKER